MEAALNVAELKRALPEFAAICGGAQEREGGAEGQKRGAALVIALSSTANGGTAMNITKKPWGSAVVGIILYL